jgi:hypothetical protein
MSISGLTERDVVSVGEHQRHPTHSLTGALTRHRTGLVGLFRNPAAATVWDQLWAFGWTSSAPEPPSASPAACRRRHGSPRRRGQSHSVTSAIGGASATCVAATNSKWGVSCGERIVRPHVHLLTSSVVWLTAVATRRREASDDARAQLSALWMPAGRQPEHRSGTRDGHCRGTSPGD